MTAEGFDGEVAIVGLGMAGLTAGLYACRGGLDAVGFERGGPGGQMNTIGLIENMVGYASGITGIDLASSCAEQALAAGLKTEFADVVAVRKADSDNSKTKWILDMSGGNQFVAAAVIIATGSRLAHLNVPGEERLEGRGVSTCATCDGEFYRGREVAVIGGGDSALDEALYLAGIASRVHVVHRRNALRGADATQRRLSAASNVSFIFDASVIEIVGDKTVSGIRLHDRLADEETPLLAVQGVFPYVGLIPNSSLLTGVVELTPSGQVSVDSAMATEQVGLFAAGDLRSGSSRQLISAAGDGATAALAALQLLRG